MRILCVSLVGTSKSMPNLACAGSVGDNIDSCAFPLCIFDAYVYITICVCTVVMFQMLANTRREFPKVLQNTKHLGS